MAVNWFVTDLVLLLITDYYNFSTYLFEAAEKFRNDVNVFVYD